MHRRSRMPLLKKVHYRESSLDPATICGLRLREHWQHPMMTTPVFKNVTCENCRRTSMFRCSVRLFS